jgi:hypothetical protein
MDVLTFRSPSSKESSISLTFLVTYRLQQVARHHYQSICRPLRLLLKLGETRLIFMKNAFSRCETVANQRGQGPLNTKERNLRHWEPLPGDSVVASFEHLNKSIYQSKPRVCSCNTRRYINKNKTNSVAWVRSRTIPSDHRLSAKLVPTVVDIEGCPLRS